MRTNYFIDNLNVHCSLLFVRYRIFRTLYTVVFKVDNKLNDPIL